MIRRDRIKRPEAGERAAAPAGDEAVENRPRGAPAVHELGSFRRPGPGSTGPDLGSIRRPGPAETVARDARPSIDRSRSQRCVAQGNAPSCRPSGSDRRIEGHEARSGDRAGSGRFRDLDCLSGGANRPAITPGPRRA